jgi:hypothetical protein
MTIMTNRPAARPFSIIETTTGKTEVIVTRVTERDAIKQSSALMQVFGGEFRAVSTAILKSAGHA